MRHVSNARMLSRRPGYGILAPARQSRTKATQRINWPRVVSSTALRSRVATSKSATSPLLLPVATYLESGAKATDHVLTAAGVGGRGR
jgi:hypothetical protein